MSALMLAVRFGRENVVRTLLAEGLEAVGGLQAISGAIHF